MTVTATYVGASAKITVAITSAPANAANVLIERSPDQVAWTAVRGTYPWAALSGGTFSVDDYEFTDGVVNYYRATYYDTITPTYIGAAAAATVTTSAGASASVTPTLPSGLVLGDIVFIALANTKATAVLPAAPAGWTQLGTTTDGLGLYVADWTASLTAPALTVTGLAGGDKVIGKAVGLRNASPLLANIQGQVNTASANIAFPAFIQAAGAVGGPLVMFVRSINTSVSSPVNTNDTATGWSLLTWEIVPASYGAGSVTVTGGVSATGSVLQAAMFARPFVTQETGNVTPALTTAWIKNPTRPYLNRSVTVTGLADVVHKARSGTFDIIGRTMPIAVTDLYSGRNSTVTVRVPDRITADDIESCLLSGETQFFHAPKGAVAPTGYFVLGDITRQRPADTGTARLLLLPVTEVAAPSPALAAVLSSWQTVISTYATWQALINAKATWNDVLQLVGSATDVITG